MVIQLKVQRATVRMLIVLGVVVIKQIKQKVNYQVNWVKVHMTETMVKLMIDILIRNYCLSHHVDSDKEKCPS